MAVDLRLFTTAFNGNFLDVRALAPDEVIATVSCSPKPRGRVSRANPPNEVAPIVDTATLQPSEAARLVAAATPSPLPARESAPTLNQVLQALFQSKHLHIDVGGFEPSWLVPAGCFDTTIAYRVFFMKTEVTCRLTAPLSVGGERFPAGDPIATFVADIPYAYSFHRSYAWNPKCCDGEARYCDDDVSEVFDGDEWHEWRERPDGKLDQFYDPGPLWPPSCEPLPPVVPEPKPTPGQKKKPRKRRSR